MAICSSAAAATTARNNCQRFDCSKNGGGRIEGIQRIRRFFGILRRLFARILKAGVRTDN